MFELLSEAPVSPECGILRLLAKSWVPVVEFVETVAEADALGHGQVAHICSLAALREAGLMQVGQQRVVLLHVRLVVVLHAELPRFCLLFIQIKHQG